MVKKKSAKALVKANNKQVTAPASVGTKMVRSAPVVNFGNNGNCIITHTEYISNVWADVGVSVIPYDINPQNSAVFTWLSALATRFEMYKFRRLKFDYKVSCSTATSGSVILGFDFDTYDSVPSKVELLAWRYSSKTSAWAPTSLDVSPDARLATDRYCTSVSRGDDRLDQLGKMYVYTDSLSAIPALIGEVYVTYTVELKIPSYSVPPALYSNFQNPGLITATNLFPTGSVIDGNIDTPILTEDTVQIRTPGAYLIDFVTTAVSGVSGNLALTFTEPTDYPGTDYTASILSTIHTSVAATLVGLLLIKAGWVNIRFTGMSGSGIAAAVRFATYKGP